MSKRYRLQTSPFVVPTTDGKLIEEYHGVPSTGDDGLSVAHMIAPAGWTEPAQVPDFDEYTLMVAGRVRVVVDGESFELRPGATLLVHRGATVRYSNPYDEPAEYWSVCVPAFSPDRTHRQE